MTKMHLFLHWFMVSNKISLTKRTFTSFSKHIDILHVGFKKQLPCCYSRTTDSFGSSRELFLLLLHDFI